jgi:hypothetical protein
MNKLFGEIDKLLEHKGIEADIDGSGSDESGVYLVTSSRRNMSLEWSYSKDADWEEVRVTLLWRDRDERLGWITLACETPDEDWSACTRIDQGCMFERRIRELAGRLRLQFGLSTDCDLERGVVIIRELAEELTGRRPLRRHTRVLSA